MVPDWLRAREKGEVKRGGLFGETRFLLVKNDSQWEIRNVKILVIYSRTYIYIFMCNKIQLKKREIRFEKRKFRCEEFI